MVAPVKICLSQRLHCDLLPRVAIERRLHDAMPPRAKRAQQGESFAGRDVRRNEPTPFRSLRRGTKSRFGGMAI